MRLRPYLRIALATAGLFVFPLAAPAQQNGRESEALAAEKKLADLLTTLDSLVKREDFCRNLAEFSTQKDNALKQSEYVRVSWQEYFKEVQQAQKLVGELAFGAADRYNKEKAQFTDMVSKLKLEVNDLKKRQADLPADVPAQRRTTLQTMIESTEKQIDSFNALLAELEEEYKKQVAVAAVNEPFKAAYDIFQKAKDGYHRANKLLIDVRYQRPLDRCLNMAPIPTVTGKD